MSSYLTTEQVEWLLRNINPKRVGKDGKGHSHVEAWEIRAHLNRVFGFARWSEEVVSQDLVFEEQNAQGKWTVCYRSVVRLTVNAPDGTVLATYTEGATGDAKNYPSRADGHDMAVKTSESQAFKRAAVNLGTAFGLSLYQNGSLNDIVLTTLVRPDRDTKADAEDVDDKLPQVAPETPAVVEAQNTGADKPMAPAAVAQQLAATDITEEQRLARQLADQAAEADNSKDMFGIMRVCQAKKLGKFTVDGRELQAILDGRLAELKRGAA